MRTMALASLTSQSALFAKRTFLSRVTEGRATKVSHILLTSRNTVCGWIRSGRFDFAQARRPTQFTAAQDAGRPPDQDEDQDNRQHDLGEAEKALRKYLQDRSEEHT